MSMHELHTSVVRLHAYMRVGVKSRDVWLTAARQDERGQMGGSYLESFYWLIVSVLLPCVPTTVSVLLPCVPTTVSVLLPSVPAIIMLISCPSLWRIASALLLRVPAAASRLTGALPAWPRQINALILHVLAHCLGPALGAVLHFRSSGLSPASSPSHAYTWARGMDCTPFGLRHEHG